MISNIDSAIIACISNENLDLVYQSLIWLSVKKNESYVSKFIEKVHELNMLSQIMVNSYENARLVLRFISKCSNFPISVIHQLDSYISDDSTCIDILSEEIVQNCIPMDTILYEIIRSHHLLANLVLREAGYVLSGKKIISIMNNIEFKGCNLLILDQIFAIFQASPVRYVFQNAAVLRMIINISENNYAYILGQIERYQLYGFIFNNPACKPIIEYLLVFKKSMKYLYRSIDDFRLNNYIIESPFVIPYIDVVSANIVGGTIFCNEYAIPYIRNLLMNHRMINTILNGIVDIIYNSTNECIIRECLYMIKNGCSYYPKRYTGSICEVSQKDWETMLGNHIAIPHIADIIAPKNVSHGISYNETTLDESVLVNAMIIPYWDGEFIENLSDFSIRNVDMFPTTFWEVCLRNANIIEEDEWKILVKSKTGYLLAVDNCVSLYEMDLMDIILESDYCSNEIIRSICKKLYIDDCDSYNIEMQMMYDDFNSTRYGCLYNTELRCNIYETPWINELMAVVYNPDRLNRMADSYGVSFMEYLSTF